MPDSFEAVARRLAENETAIGGLYELFAEAFAVDRVFWAGLANEEHQHAAWILSALEAIAPDQRRQVDVQARVPAIDLMIGYVASLADRCRRGELARLTALALARDLENSLLEGRILTSIATSAGRLAELRADLLRATTAHRQRIADVLDRARQAETEQVPGRS